MKFARFISVTHVSQMNLFNFSLEMFSFFSDQRGITIILLAFSVRFMVRALRAWAINREEETRSVTYSTDLELG